MNQVTFTKHPNNIYNKKNLLDFDTNNMKMQTFRRNIHDASRKCIYYLGSFTLLKRSQFQNLHTISKSCISSVGFLGLAILLGQDLNPASIRGINFFTHPPATEFMSWSHVVLDLFRIETHRWPLKTFERNVYIFFTLGFVLMRGETPSLHFHNWENKHIHVKGFLMMMTEFLFSHMILKLQHWNHIHPPSLTRIIVSI